MKNHSELLKEFEQYENKIDWECFIAWNLFKKHKKFVSLNEWSEFISDLNEKELQKLNTSSYFYYFTCNPIHTEGKEDFRDEFRLVAVISLMENLMSKDKYKDFFSWYESKYNTEEIVNYSEAKEKYLSCFGAIRNFKEYINRYLNNEDIQYCLDNIEKWNQGKKEFKKLNTKNDLANFFYNMRSEFVHEAKMVMFNNPGSLFSGIHVKGKPYCIKLEMNEFLNIFERSFINYWENIQNHY